MKILFLLDNKDEQGNILEANARLLELAPGQLQLRQTGVNETWLSHPVNETTFYPLVRFDVGLTLPVPVIAKPVKTKAVAKKAAKKASKGK